MTSTSRLALLVLTALSGIIAILAAALAFAVLRLFAAARQLTAAAAAGRRDGVHGGRHGGSRWRGCGRASRR